MDPAPTPSRLILYEYSFSKVPRLPEEPLLSKKVERFDEGAKLAPPDFGSLKAVAVEF